MYHVLVQRLIFVFIVQVLQNKYIFRKAVEDMPEEKLKNVPVESAITSSQVLEVAVGSVLMIEAPNFATMCWIEVRLEIA